MSMSRLQVEREVHIPALANILPSPVHRQTPRYPLAIAEFDLERCRILRDTVQTIQHLPPGAPAERRYTN